jgi:nucleoside-diphosphate-sugar epimerase
MKKKIVVLGATGFVGRNMAEYFAGIKNAEVTGTYCRSNPWQHPRVRMVQVDLTRKADVERVIKDCDLLIQAAAVTSGASDIVNNPHHHITDNAVMNSLIFRAAFDMGVPHIIFFSCSVMYHPSETPLKERDFDPNRPMHANYFGGAWNKIYFEKMCEFYARQGRNRYTVIRHSNNYGPYDKFDLQKGHVFGATMAKVMTAPDDGRIVIWGTGEEKRDLLHISDLVHLVELASQRQKQPFALYNAGTGRPIAVKELVRKIRDCSGKYLVLEHDLSKPTIPITICLDSTKAKTELGWSPRIDIERGIEKTMQWYRRHEMNAIEQTPSST